MGFRFSLNNANAVGYLIEGNVMTFLDESSKSYEMNMPNLMFIDTLLENIQEDFYTSDAAWDRLSSKIQWLRYEWEHVKILFENIRDFSNRDDLGSITYHHRLLNFLTELSAILMRCKTRTLLLPGFEYSYLDERMRDRDFLKELVRTHPGASALILQMKEAINKSNISVLNVFPKFEKAYSNIDLWPGVLLWNDNESMFLKVESEHDIHDIYSILRFERDSIKYLSHKYEGKQANRKNAYFFHLSDLHFGNVDSNRRKSRLTKILETNLNKLDDKSVAIPIITGDLVDSPNKANLSTYLEFCESLKDKGFEKPIQILGNHDVDTSGIIKTFTTQKSVISQLSGQNNIEIIKDLSLAFVKFNSNSGGDLAQGEIGVEQLMNIGSEIDSIKDGNKLTYIALVHHHPKEIDNPYWYKRDWYEALLGNAGYQHTMKLLDSELFLEWIENRGIKLILHGHKHIPNIQEHNDIRIIASGSSTGRVKHQQQGKTYLTYNLIKYSIDEQRPLSCSVIAEENLGSGTKNMLLYLL